MPSTLESIAAFIQDSRQATHSGARMENLRLHVADTVGMLLAGALLAEGRTAMSLGSRLAGWCASVRLTEGDDIHLTSCTTPGSVVVPTALHLASEGAFQAFGDFVAAVLAGYETLIRVGRAIHGPRILAMKFWPTLFAAPMGAAAVACRAWKLNRSQTAGALATALAGSTATAPPAMMPDSSRCISLGFAAECGVRAAVAAKQGALGDPQLLETYAGRVAGVRVSPREHLGNHGCGAACPAENHR
jgi:2-methylcitrate dehydratase PrpD